LPREDLLPKGAWSAKQFAAARTAIRTFDAHLDSRRGDLHAVRDYLVPRRSFILGMLQNPNLLEHEEFAETLWAVMHLTDELVARKSLDGLPEPDMNHLSVDVQRAYKALVEEWLHYMEHLKTDYPYLFALALRTNPFDPKATVEVTA
jgi:hypothetical protein